MKMYDEKEAVVFIRSKVDCGQLNDDDLLDIIDAIFDFYDENGELDVDFDEDEDDEELNPDNIVSYISEEFPEMDKKTVSGIVKAELDYENSLL